MLSRWADVTPSKNTLQYKFQVHRHYQTHVVGRLRNKCHRFPERSPPQYLLVSLLYGVARHLLRPLLSVRALRASGALLVQLFVLAQARYAAVMQEHAFLTTPQVTVVARRVIVSSQGLSRRFVLTKPESPRKCSKTMSPRNGHEIDIETKFGKTKISGPHCH